MFDIIPNRKRNNSLFNFDNFFSEFFPDDFFPNNDRFMKLDIKEFSSVYVFDIELPGVKRDEIDLNIADDILTISVKISEQTNEEDPKYIRKERKYGSYSRSFAIPNIDSENIKANYDNGVLTVTLPKAVPQTISKRNISIE